MIDWIVSLFVRTEMVRDFPCDNWAGVCSKPCGYCSDRKSDDQQWAYRSAPRR